MSQGRCWDPAHLSRSEQPKQKCQVCRRMEKVGKTVRASDLSGNPPVAWGVAGQVVD